MTKRPYPPEPDAELVSLLSDYEKEKQRGLQEFVKPRFTLATITTGLGIPEVTVRNWLTRKQIDLGSSIGHAPGKWRLFSIRDALVLSTCFLLSRHGVPVSVFEMVYSKVVRLASMYFSGPVGMVRNPIGVLHNDGEWRMELSFDSGPVRITGENSPPVAVIIDFDKIIFGTQNRLGLNAALVRADGETT